jgi:tight adherence protein B
MMSWQALGPYVGLACKVVAVLAAALSAYLFAVSVASGRWRPAGKTTQQYTDFVQRLARANALSISPTRFVQIQALAILSGPVVAIACSDVRMLLLSLLAAVIPPYLLLRKEQQRRADCDRQATGFVLTLANALKVVPNIGSALEGIVPVLREPLRREIVAALGEMAVGSSVDVALRNASIRARSKGFDSCIAALLVGRQVGGNLPSVLETTAETMREMERLDGVVQTKTAEGRAQLIVLLMLPAVIAVAFSVASPGYFEPLQTTWLGRAVVLGIVLLWGTSIALARKILAVDL